MENRMEEVAKLLGVELDEPFNIVGRIENPFTLTSTGLIDCHDYTSPLTLVTLLLGKREITIQLLTEEEKEYLEYVLRQYKENVKSVKKRINLNGEFLTIKINRGGLYEDFDLPYIKEDHLQYKRLSIEKRYTLKDLGLFEGE